MSKKKPEWSHRKNPVPKKAPEPKPIEPPIPPREVLSENTWREDTLDYKGRRQFKASTREAMAFLGLLAIGKSPFEAARSSGRPLSFWRGLRSQDPDFRMAYDAAMEDYAHAIASEAMDYADNADPESKAGVMKAKLQVDTRFRMAKAYAREVFGDKVDVTKRTEDVRRTEFVSYFGIRVMKQDEPDGETLRKVIDANTGPRLGSGRNQRKLEDPHARNDGEEASEAREDPRREGALPEEASPDEEDVSRDDSGAAREPPQAHEADGGDEGDLL